MLILSNCLSKIADEGCLKVAVNLVGRIKKAQPQTMVVTYDRESEISDIHLQLNKLLLNKQLISILRRYRGQVLYIPFPARTLATAIRIFILSLFAGKGLKVVSVMKYHNNFISRILLRLSGAEFIAFSKDAADYYKSILGDKRVTYLTTGVDTEKFVPVSAEKSAELKNKNGFDSSRPVILHVGHLNYGRNIAELMKFDEKYQILLVTSTLTKDEQDAELKNRLLSCPNIKLIDYYVPNIEEIYQLSDMYFFPVLEAGKCIDIPLSAMEAAACNKPIITTDYGEMKSFLDKNGFYYIDSFERDDLNALAEKAINIRNISSRDAVLGYDWNNAVSYFLK